LTKLLRSRVAAVTVAAGVLVSVGGVGGAYAARMITGADVKNGSLHSADIANNNLRGSDVQNGSLGLRDMNDYTRGHIDQGVTGLVTARADVVWKGNESTRQAASVSCPMGKYAVGGGYDLVGFSTPPTYVRDNITVELSIPGASDGKTINDAGGFEPDGWIVKGYNWGDQDFHVFPYVICADAPTE
jgi:hypothetical protein